MGRAIPEDRPLSDEDRAFLLERSMRSTVESIDRAFPPEGKSEPVEPSDSEGSDDEVEVEPSDSEGSDDEVEVDEDISTFVDGLPNKDAVKSWLDTVEVKYDDDDHREDLNTLLAIELQERRDRGEEVKLEA